MYKEKRKFCRGVLQTACPNVLFLIEFWLMIHCYANICEQLLAIVITHLMKHIKHKEKLDTNNTITGNKVTEKKAKQYSKNYVGEKMY